MRILVTGANGFLGKRVVEKLRSHGGESLQIRCLVRKGSSLNGIERHGVDVFRGSLNDESIMQDMLAGVDTVIHLAASMSGSPMGMFTETVVSTEKLMSAVQQSEVRRIVFCSSFSVYGASQLASGSTFDENCPLEPVPHKRDPYAWCKFYQEQWVRDHAGGRELLVLRPGVIYGDDKGLLSPRVGMALPGLPFFLKIGGRARVPLTHVENCADAFALAALKEGVGSQTFNVVDDNCPTQSQYLKIYQRAFGKIPNKVPMPYPVFLLMCWSFEQLHRISKGNFPGIFSPYKAKSMFRPFSYSNSKLKQVLGWQPLVSLSQGIESSVEFSRK